MRRIAIALIALVTFAASTAIAGAHGGVNDGHVPANTNYGFNVIGRDLLAGEAAGLYTDVWSHEGFAYVGTFQDPECTDAGVFVVDIAAAVANYPDTEGATVAHIRSAPNTL